MISKVYIRDALRSFIVWFTLYAILEIYLIVSASKKFPDESIIRITTDALRLTFIFSVPAMLYLARNIIYWILFVIAVIRGNKCTAEITDIEITHKLLDVRFQIFRFVVKTPEGLYKRSVCYNFEISDFYENYPERTCTIYCLGNMIFITKIK